jgi:monofunctional chorismate mutase
VSYENEIEELRKEINRLNTEIVEKLAQRVKVAKEIGAVKKRHGLPIVDRGREKRVIEQVKGLALSLVLDADGTERVFREIIRLCTEAETEDS